MATKTKQPPKFPGEYWIKMWVVGQIDDFVDPDEWSFLSDWGPYRYQTTLDVEAAFPIFDPKYLNQLLRYMNYGRKPTDPKWYSIPVQFVDTDKYKNSITRAIKIDTKRYMDHRYNALPKPSNLQFEETVDD